MRKVVIIFLLFCMFSWVSEIHAQDLVPSIDPVGVVIHEDGTEEKMTNFSGSAPLRVRFEPGIEDAEDCDVYCEWRFYMEKESAEHPYLVRHENTTEMTFLNDGSHCVILIAYFVQGNDTIARYDLDYWADNTPLRFTIERSKLEFPNAFSPNGDDVNDVYRAKPGYSSIIEFKATIYNRWGQKIYEWTDPAGGWDGKFNGHDVKQGVYYVHVVAKGADGRKYNIKRDVNLLRGYQERMSNGSME